MYEIKMYERETKMSDERVTEVHLKMNTQINGKIFSDSTFRIIITLMNKKVKQNSKRVHLGVPARGQRRNTRRHKLGSGS